MEVSCVYIKYHDVSCFNGLGRWFLFGEQPRPMGLVVGEQFFSEFSQVQGLQHGYEGGTSALNKLVESIAKRMEVCGFLEMSRRFGLGNKNMVGWFSKEKETAGS